MNFIFVELFFEEMLFRGRIVRERLLAQKSRGLDVSLTLALMLCDTVQVSACLWASISFSVY